MKALLQLVLLFFIHFQGTSQTVKEFHQKAIAALDKKDYVTALDNFNEAAKLSPMDPTIWYNKGLVHLWMKQYEQSIADLNQAISLSPLTTKAYTTRGYSKQQLTDYDGAMADYNRALEIDSKNLEALYRRGELRQRLGQFELGCADFKLSYELGDKDAKQDVENCETADFKKTNSILRLTKMSEDSTYGLTGKNPVKCGKGPRGGPANQRAYLNLLRDVNGKPLDYTRSGSCCAYKSENGLFGSAMVDVYEVKHTDSNGNPKTTQIYISFYDHEEPRIPHGFRTVKPLTGNSAQ
jgi:tetratricopeptide (TPR) repeat protein